MRQKRNTLLSFLVQLSFSFHRRWIVILIEYWTRINPSAGLSKLFSHHLSSQITTLLKEHGFSNTAVQIEKEIFFRLAPAHITRSFCTPGGNETVSAQAYVTYGPPAGAGYQSTVLTVEEEVKPHGQVCVCVCVCQNEESARRMASTTSENRKRNEKKSTEKEEARFVSRVTVILTREKERDYLLNLHMSQSTCVGTWIETGVDFYGWQCVCYNGKKSARRMACRTSDTGDTSSKQQQTRRKENYNKSKRPVSSVVDHYHPYRRKKRREAVY